jgi:hypothetical protein
MVLKRGREGTVSLKGPVRLGHSGAKMRQEEDNKFAFVGVPRAQWHAMVHIWCGSERSRDP